MCVPLGSFPHVILQKARLVVAEKLDHEKAALKAYQQQLDELAETIVKITQQIADAELATKAAEHEIAGLSKERAGLETRLAELEKLNPWFADEKRYAAFGHGLVFYHTNLLALRNFGKPGGTYDFSAMDLQATKEAAKKADEQSKGMKRKVNAKVMHMIEGYVFSYSSDVRCLITFDVSVWRKRTRNCKSESLWFRKTNSRSKALSKSLTERRWRH